MNTNEIKGYLNIEPQAEFQNGGRIEDFLDPVPDVLSSFAGQGWFEITHSIPDGEFVKISAERNSIKIEAKFNILKNVPRGDNGAYEIRNGLFAGNGIFRNISPKDRGDINFQAKDNGNFAHFFICHSVKSGSSSLLRWRVALREFPTSTLPSNLSD